MVFDQKTFEYFTTKSNAENFQKELQADIIEKYSYTRMCGEFNANLYKAYRNGSIKTDEPQEPYIIVIHPNENGKEVETKLHLCSSVRYDGLLHNYSDQFPNYSAHNIYTKINNTIIVAMEGPFSNTAVVRMLHDMHVNKINVIYALGYHSIGHNGHDNYYHFTEPKKYSGARRHI